jgi:hypothetical protein
MPFVLIKKTDNYLKVFITVAFIFIIIIVINEYKKKSSKKFIKESFSIKTFYDKLINKSPVKISSIKSPVKISPIKSLVKKSLVKKSLDKKSLVKTSSNNTSSNKSDASSIKPVEQSIIKSSSDKSSSDKSASDKTSSDKSSSNKTSSNKTSSDKSSSDKSSSDKSSVKITSDKSSSTKSDTSSIKPFEKSVIKSSYNQTKSYTLGVCSKNCCSTQWKTNIDVTERSKVKSIDVGPGKKYLTSNMTCNNGVINTGCVCISDETKKMFNNRGFVKEVPMSNGLLDADYTISPFTYPKQLNSLDTKDNYYMLSNFSMSIDDNLINYYDNKPIDKFTTDQLISYPIGISDRS